MMTPSAVTNSRLRSLKRLRQLVNAEIVAIESGILPLIEEYGPLSVKQLHYMLSSPTSVQSINNQMARLVEAGVVHRRKASQPIHSGSRYVYFVPGQ